MNLLIVDDDEIARMSLANILAAGARVTQAADGEQAWELLEAGLRPDACVIVATIRALKYHGGADLKALGNEDLAALEKGIANLERHVNNVRNHYGLPCVVSINHFSNDTPAEIALLQRKMAHHEAPVVVARHWAEGGKGAEALASTVVDLIERTPTDFRFVYEDDAPLWDKLRAVATKIYGAIDVSADIGGKKFSGSTGLGQYMHDNPLVPSCLVRRVQSYGSGRAYERGDAKQVEARTAAFAADGYKWGSLLRSVLTDPQFYSVSAPEGAAPRLQAASGGGNISSGDGR